MLKRLTAAILFLCSLGLAGCGAAGTNSIRNTKEIKEYLESRYGSQDFLVEPSEKDGAAAYRAVPADYPEVTFTIEEGKLEESSDYSYHDDFAAQMLYGGADRLGLSYEKGADGYDIFITYENFASLDTLGEQLEKLVMDCRDSRAFDELRSSCLITVKPEAETNPYFPGYEIRLKTRYTYPLTGDFGVMASELEEGKLTDALKRCHVYTAYNYTIPEDSAMFSSSDIKSYLDSCTGATGEASPSLPLKKQQPRKMQSAWNVSPLWRRPLQMRPHRGRPFLWAQPRSPCWAQSSLKPFRETAWQQCILTKMRYGAPWI